MEDFETLDLLAPTLSQFKGISSSAPVDVRESIALVDFHLRLIYTLSIASSRRPQCSPLRVSQVPGFGTMLAVVRRGGNSTADTSNWINELIINWSDAAVSAIDRFKAPRYGSFKILRDRLSHGQPLPNDLGQLQSLRDAIGGLTLQLENLLRQYLSGTRIDIRQDRLFLQKPRDRSSFEISPFWVWAPNESAINVYSHASAEGINYIASDGDVFTEKSSEAIAKFLKNYVSSVAGNQTDLGRLVRDVLADIGAYTEDYSKPSYFFGDDEDIGTLFVPWVKSTSENNQSRLDSFRIGPDNRREWRMDSSSPWRGYSDFLKHVSNWELLARRIAIGLDNFTHERAEEESSRLGFPKWDATRGPTLIKEKKDPLSREGGEKEFDLVARIDDSCQRMKPSTSVFFIIGQAGLGKTDLMVSAAVERARKIESDPGSPLPLYLFVSSSGRTLSSLEDAVNSALNITKLLSSHSAKALCRNGLLVLLVDGFDELLGSSGYENALGSLEPWFRELGGRGVLAASARSSYYLTQYRRSLALATDLNVDHTLVELQPWSRSSAKQFLVAMGVQENTLCAIKEREWSVLSVPFFAKAFAAWLKNEGVASNSLPSVYDIVVAQYLTREALKLKDPNIGELLTTDELRELFSEIAELMQTSKNREIDQSELVSCAESVVGTSSLEAARPGLTRRLSSLCGLGATSDSAGGSSFGFSHEVLFDCFLSVALQRRVSGIINEKSLLALLGATKVNAAAFEWLLEKKDGATAILSEKISFSIPADQDSAVLSSNLGSLWSAMLSQRKGIPPTAQASGLQIEALELAGHGWTSLDVSRSAISRLVLPDSQHIRVDLSHSDVGYLEARSNECARRCLKGVESAKVMSVHIGNQFEDSKTRVRELFENLGLVSRTVRTINQQYRESASYFLDRLARRPDTPVVLSREDLSADDDRLLWIQHADSDHWRSFVDALTRSGVARLEPLTASGRAKVRIAFSRPIRSLQEPDPEDTESALFWDLLG